MVAAAALERSAIAAVNVADLIAPCSYHFCLLCGEQKRQNPAHMKTNTLPLLLIPLLTCFSLSPVAQAVVPAPDGGYAGGNTAEGQNALSRLTTGTYNTAIGLSSLSILTDGQLNTAVGAGSLLVNTSDGNTAIGAGALLSNTGGNNNTAAGAFALFFNAKGVANSAFGWGALESNTDGGDNTAIGTVALQLNTAGNNNTAVGYAALENNLVGFFNTATGNGALEYNSSGSNNTAIGNGALAHNTTGGFNTAVGIEALEGNGTGNNNTALGVGAGSNVTGATNVIAIGTAGASVDNSCFIGNIRDVQTQNTDAIPVVIDSAGQLGTASSSGRFKDEIKPMDTASEAILALKPVTFQYKSDTNSRPQFGLIAEEVAKVNPDLVVCDKNGDVYTVRYDTVNAMLLNEFLKEHRKVERLEANAAQQQKQIDALAAGLQKVSAQLQVSKPAPETVLNNR